MKNLATCLVFILLGVNNLFSQVQEKSKPIALFEKKLVYGFAVNNSWSNYRDLKDSSFYRPSLGIHLKTDFFFTESIGITLGFGVQQRGMGIYTPDLDKSIGNPDSTGRLRYKCTTLDLPIQLVYRHKEEVFKNGRLIAGFGITPSYMYKAQRIWKSVDDGFHEPRVITGNYSKIDVPLRASLGLDINTGSTLFRVQLVGELGFKKIYTNSITGAKSSQNTLIGIDLSFLF